MKIALILGTRPQIIKSAPIIDEALNADIDIRVIHTGQHYDYELSDTFFDSLGLDKATINLGIGSGAHGRQTGQMLIEIERVLMEIVPDQVLIPGDTNSTLAGALAAAKLNIKINHVEAGARSYDDSMPEETNRKLTDHCSETLFTVSENCSNNLINEGISEERIHHVGDTMYDLILSNSDKIDANPIRQTVGVIKDEYAVVTVHRQENVDNIDNLRSIIRAIVDNNTMPIVFPIHPRTRKQVTNSGLFKAVDDAYHIKLISPVNYHEMINLMKGARMVLTDSGGMQKEAYWMKTPCITLRTTSEWVETLESGANVLVGADYMKISDAVNNILNDGIESDVFRKGIYGSGDAARKIVEILKK